MSRWRVLGWVVVALALVAHFLLVSEEWSRARGYTNGLDYASYHYAAQVAWEGGDPYDKRALGAAAREEGARKSVHPYFYPPAFLLFVSWTLPLDLVTGYRVWFWLDEALMVAAMLALWRWWRPLGPAVGPLLALTLAAWTAVPNNHVMGQANALVLLLVLAGLWQEDRGRWALGGALVGAAAMLKMSPALFVGWWLLHRKWRPALAAVVAGLVLEVAALGVASPEAHLQFWLHVLPGFSSGEYNGLTVPIGLFGNHSIPDVLHQLWPGGPHRLSATASRVSTVITLALLGLGGWWMRRPAPDLLGRGAQASLVAVIMLLIPVYTYEHHLIWAIPGAVLAGVALARRDLHLGWSALLLPAWLALSFELSLLKRWSRVARLETPAWSWLLQEVKFLALVLLLVVLARMARRRPL